MSIFHKLFIFFSADVNAQILSFILLVTPHGTMKMLSRGNRDINKPGADIMEEKMILLTFHLACSFFNPPKTAWSL